MAIVSISRIQHRRGLQQDLPQLASAELGWSLDSQRLYIGNGTIGEGAPRLGNTEILTEHSDILQLAQTYTYLNEDAGYTPTTGGKNNKFNAIAYGSGIYVAVGTNGAILTSTDTVTWSPVFGGTNNTLNSICYGVIGSTGYFVAVGSSGTIIYSADGAVWNQASTTVLLTLTSITYAASLNTFVAVSNTGSAIISSDANTWATYSTGVSSSLNSVAYNSGMLVAVGTGGNILTSVNGTSWTQQLDTTLNNFTLYNLLSVKWDNDQWIAAGEYNTVLVSVDGVNWYYGFTDTIRAAADNTGEWIFVGDGGVIFKSSGALGTDLVLVDSGTTENLYDIVYSTTLNQFVAVGANGKILVSSTGVGSWASVTSGTTEDLNKIYYNKSVSVYVAVGNSGTIVTSSNGSTWTTVASGTTYNLYGISFLPSPATYIAVGDHGTILISSGTSAATWSAVSTGLLHNLRSVTVADLGGGSYKTVAVGLVGAIITSTAPATTWTDLTNSSITSQDLHGVNYITWTYNGITSSKYFIVGNNATALSSDDAISWPSPLYIPTNSHFTNIYYGFGNFWITGSIGYSTVYGYDVTDSTTLTAQAQLFNFNTSSGNSGPSLFSSSYGLGYYTLFGQYDSILTSIDGQNFITQSNRTFTVTSLSLSDIQDGIFENNQFVAVGSKGLILKSTDSVTWSGTSYVYGNAKTTRTLQHKLDDFVSVKDFGAKGDGLTDDTESINRALYEIYCRTSNPAARKVLYFPAGRYIVSDGINVPSNAVIKGEGSYNTIIQQTADPTYISYVLTTADSLQQIGSYLGYNGAKLPSDIIVEDIGLESKADGIWIIQTNRFNLTRVRLTGNTNLATDSGNQTVGIYILGANMNNTQDINVTDCFIEKFNYGVFQPSTEYSRNLIFNSCSFINMYKGLDLCYSGGAVNTMTVSNCVFDLIYSHAIDANYVNNITSTFNSYRDVGNNYNGIGNAVTTIINYDANSVACSSINDQFDRTEEESYSVAEWVKGNTTSIMLASGRELRIGLWEQANGVSYTLQPGETNAALGLSFVINDSSFNQKIQYVIVRNGATRSGILFLTYNATSGNYNLDDDSNQTDDVGVVFGLSSDGTNLNVLYTSTAGGTSFNTVMAPSYLDTVW
jgi:hypothetical protein